MSHDYDVLLLGGYFCDLIFTGLPEMPRLGAEVYGSAFDMVPGAAYTTAPLARCMRTNVSRTGTRCLVDASSAIAMNAGQTAGQTMAR